MNRNRKTVALFGGSFNPPHEGHFAMASYIHRTLKADETWMLFSQNPHKDPGAYPSLEHRMNMARIIAAHYDTPIILSDEEAEIARETGHNETVHILGELQKRYPENKFVFAMGADSFANFHLWEKYGEIIENYIIAVVDRPGYTAKALASPAAQLFSELKIDITNPENLADEDHGWCFLESPLVDISSSGILKKFSEGYRGFGGHFHEVENYIHANGLYGTNSFQPQYQGI